MARIISNTVVAFILWIWVAVLLGALAWALRQRFSTMTGPGVPTVRGPELLGGTHRAILLCVIVAFTALVLWRESFTDYDFSFFTTRTLLGRPIPPPAWPGDGRFWPLGYQEFNYVRFLTTSASGYQVLPIAQFLLFLVAVNRILADFGRTARTALLVTVTVTPGIAIAFSGLVFPERSILLALAWLLVLLRRFDQRATPRLLAGIIVCAHVALYYKEPVFVLFLVFAGSRILLASRDARANGRKVSAESIRAEQALVALSVILILLFGAALLHGEPMGYATRYRLSFESTVARYATVNLLAFVFVGVVAIRAVRFAMGRYQPDRFWDPLALGAAAYVAFYFAIRIYRPYYLAPADLVAVLYLGRAAREVLSGAGLVRRVVVATATVLLVTQAVAATSLRLLDRKSTMIAKETLADYVLEVIADAKADRVDLYFPWASPYAIVEWGSYLAFRGARVEQPEAASAPDHSGPLVVLHAPLAFSDNQCVWWRVIACRTAERPPAGSYVIVLPDDGYSREAGSDSLAGVRLMSLEPPALARRLKSLLSPLSLVTPQHGGRRLPTDWLAAEIRLAP